MKKAEDPASKERLGKLQAELANTREKLGGLTARWDAEKAGHNKVGDLRAQARRQARGGRQGRP